MLKYIEYINTIENMKLFQNQTKEELNELLSLPTIEIKKYHKEQIIHIQNETCTSIDIILKGEVSIQKIDESGNIFTIDVFTEQEILGANLIFASKNLYPMMAIATCETTLLSLNKKIILDLCINNNNFMMNLLNVISDKAIILTEKINTISLKTIRKQIISFLKSESDVQKSNRITLPISKKKLAERFGIHRTSLSRELAKMKKEGIIMYDAKTITILKNI